MWEDADRQVGVLPLMNSQETCARKGVSPLLYCMASSEMGGCCCHSPSSLSPGPSWACGTCLGAWLPPPVGGVSVRRWALSSLTVVQSVNLQLLTSCHLPPHW